MCTTIDQLYNLYTTTNTNITSTKTVIEGNHILPYHTTLYTALNERQIYRHWCSVNYSKYRILHLATKNNRNDYTFLHNRPKPNQETKIIIIYRQLLKQNKKLKKQTQPITDTNKKKRTNTKQNSINNLLHTYTS